MVLYYYWINEWVNKQIRVKEKKEVRTQTNFEAVKENKEYYFSSVTPWSIKKTYT